MNHVNLSQLPYCPFGVVDTVKLMLKDLLHPDDRCNLTDWKWTGRQLSRTGHDTTATELWVDDPSGARLRAGAGGITVEVSVPRVLGWSHSACSDMLSEDQVIRALLAVTENLLPRTTAAAAGRGVGWCLQRLDLAVNFKGSVSQVVEIYRSADHPRIRGGSTVYEGRGLSWYGSHRELVVYDPTYPRRRSSGKRSVIRATRRKAIGASCKSGKSVRVEVRLRGRAALAELLAVLPKAQGAVGLPVCSAEAPFAVSRLHPDHNLLRAFVAAEVAGLLGQTLQSIESESVQSPMRRIALAHLAENPALLAALKEEVSPKTFRDIRRQVLSIRIKDSKADLLQLGWRQHPITDPVLLRKLHDQRAAMNEAEMSPHLLSPRRAEGGTLGARFGFVA